jgi:PAS domain S-box-containing protein
MDDPLHYLSEELQNFIKDNEDYKALTRILYHNSNDLLLFLDPLGRIVSINKAGLDFSGFSREEVIGNMFWKIPGVFTINKVGGYLSVFKDALLGKTRHHFTSTLINKNNREHTMDFSAIPIKNKGKVRFILVIGKDITEKMEIEEAYHRTVLIKSNLQNIIDSSPQLILAINKDSTVTLWNKTLELFTGYLQKEIIGKSISSIPFLEKPQRFLEFIENVKKGNEGKIENITINCKNNFEKSVSFLGSPILGNIEQNEGVVLIGHDTTIDKETINRLLPGISYIDFSSSNAEIMQLFLNIASTGYDAFIISRVEQKALEKYKSFINIFECTFSAYSSDEKNIIHSSDDLYKRIKNFVFNHDKSIIFLDRIDFILVRESFEIVLQMIYKIQDIVAGKGAIFLLRVNSTLLMEQQQELLKEELEPIHSHSLKDLYIDDAAIDVLHCILKQEKAKKHSSMKDIGQQLDISKMTVAKRITLLEDLMLIQIQKQGRKKIVLLTEKGKEVLSNVDSIE